MAIRILQGDVLEMLATLPDEAVHMVCTSPPYWGLRQYVADDAPEKQHEIGLEPFGGSGTTGLVADRLQRNAVLIELNPAYAEMARRRLSSDAGMFAAVQLEAAQ